MAAHNIDATNQALGRIASRIAVLLRGKHLATYAPNVLANEKVIVTNIAKMKFIGSKLETKVYYRYSGYPGGIRARTLGKRMELHPEKVLWQAIYNMLPENRMRSKLMKHLELHA